MNTPAPQAEAPDLVRVAAVGGVVVWVDRLARDAMLAAGGGELRVVIQGDTSGWIDSSDAAMRHMEDIDGMTLRQARVRISRACSRGEVRSTGEGQHRWIDPVSLDAWRLRQRERSLDATARRERPGGIY